MSLAEKTLLTLPCLWWARWTIFVLLLSFFLISWQWLLLDSLVETFWKIRKTLSPSLSSYRVHSNWNKLLISVPFFFCKHQILGISRLSDGDIFLCFSVVFLGGGGCLVLRFHFFPLLVADMVIFFFCCCCTITKNGIAGNTTTTILTITKRTFSATSSSASVFSSSWMLS